jgi:sugar phosphate isomerase/epimerase
MHRRTFLTTLGATLVAPSVACAMPRAGVVTSRRLGRVGLQLWTLRDVAKVNLDQTLADIAAIGYKDVEMLMSMGNFGSSPAQVRAMLDKHGLRAPSTHMGTRNLEQLDKALDEAAVIGHQYIFLANLPDEGRKSLDTFRAWADRLNRAGEMARKRGVWIGVHDELQDFVTFNGRVGYDVLMERLDPKLVRAQLDVGNAVMGGKDPIPYLDKYGALYASFHIKDVKTLGVEKDVELGKGIVDLRGVLGRIKDIDSKLVYVEQETYPGAPIDSARRDYEYISRLAF